MGIGGKALRADLEVIFAFNGTRKKPMYDGYRPAHKLMEDCLTTGTHHYYDTECVYPNGNARGTISFICPEHYPACCWVGKRISIQEGGRVIGFATIVKVLNPILLLNENSEEDLGASEQYSE